jgi:hypothetical protein
VLDTQPHSSLQYGGLDLVIASGNWVYRALLHSRDEKYTINRHTAVLAPVSVLNFIMVSFKLLVVSSVASVAIAHPQPTPAAHLEERTDCAKINGALTILKKLGPPATSFCSSYLKVPMTKTLTTTTTPVV